MKVQVKLVKKSSATWCVFINGIEYQDCGTQAAAIHLKKVVKADFARHGASAFAADAK